MEIEFQYMLEHNEDYGCSNFINETHLTLLNHAKPLLVIAELVVAFYPNPRLKYFTHHCHPLPVANPSEVPLPSVSPAASRAEHVLQLLTRGDGRTEEAAGATLQFTLSQR